MLQAVDNDVLLGIVTCALGKDNIAVFTSELKYQLFRNDFAGLAQHVNFQGYDAVEATLVNLSDAPLLQMLAQQHAKARRSFGVFRLLAGNVERRAGAVHIGHECARIPRALYQ